MAKISCQRLREFIAMRTGSCGDAFEPHARHDDDPDGRPGSDQLHHARAQEDQSKSGIL